MSKVITSHGASYLIQNKQFQLIKEKEIPKTYTKHDYLFKRLLGTFFAEAYYSKVKSINLLSSAKKSSKFKT